MTEIEAYINRTLLPTSDMMKNYFKKKYRGRFYVDMKVCACHYLKESGLTIQEIAKTVYGNKERHDTIIHFLKRENNDVDSRVFENWMRWINDGLYPKTVGKDVKDGEVYLRRLIDFKLTEKL